MIVPRLWPKTIVVLIIFSEVIQARKTPISVNKICVQHNFKTKRLPPAGFKYHIC